MRKIEDVAGEEMCLPVCEQVVVGKMEINVKMDEHQLS